MRCYLSPCRHDSGEPGIINPQGLLAAEARDPSQTCSPMARGERGRWLAWAVARVGGWEAVRKFDTLDGWMRLCFVEEGRLRAA